MSKPPEERRAELIAAARELFDKNGVGATRVSDIVRAVGVAQGVFYYYFASKEEMVQTVAAELLRETQQKLAAIESGSADFCARLAGVIDLYLDVMDQFLGDEEQNTRALEDDVLQHNPIAMALEQLLGDRLVQTVEAGAAAGQIAAAYPGETMRVLLYGLRRLATEQLPKRRMIYTVCEQALCLPAGGLAG